MDTYISKYYGSPEEERDAVAHQRVEELARTPEGANMVLDAYKNPDLRAQIDAVHGGLDETAIETLMMEVASSPLGAQLIWDLSQHPVTGACMEEYPTTVLECAVRTLFDHGRTLLAGKLA